MCVWVRIEKVPGQYVDGTLNISRVAERGKQSDWKWCSRECVCMCVLACMCVFACVQCFVCVCVYQCVAPPCIDQNRVGLFLYLNFHS